MCRGPPRLRFEDGTEMRVTYAAKSGQAFTGPGRVLADLGEIPLEAVTMQSIRAWFRDNPHRIDEILAPEPLLHLLPRSTGRRCGIGADRRGQGAVAGRGDRWPSTGCCTHSAARSSSRLRGWLMRIDRSAG